MKKLIFLAVIMLLTSCGEKKETPKPIEWDQEKSTKMNKNLAEEEKIQIKLFLAQHSDWKVEETGTGLQYYIYENGTGAQAQVGQLAEVEMTIKLLDGKEVYKTAADEVEEFMIDKSEVESGVHEGIKKMKVGDKAKLIIPSHLAHGLIGDFNKIPPLSVLVVDIHLIALN